MASEREKLFEAILDSIPYKIVFMDTDFVIRFMNKTAKHHYYGMRGYRDLEGKSIFACHNEKSAERFYINPVRDENGELIGFFERFEMNLQK